jgi:hypothetical protein
MVQTKEVSSTGMAVFYFGEMCCPVQAKFLLKLLELFLLYISTSEVALGDLVASEAG